MPLLIILGILAVQGILCLKESLEPELPAIEDWDAYWKATRGKTPKEIRKIHRDQLSTPKRE